MASKLSDVFDSLNTRLAALFPNKTIIPYPYSLTDAPTAMLKDSYGLKVGSGSDSDLSTDYLNTTNRTYSVVLVREVYGFASVETTINAATKAIFDDQYALKNDLLDLMKVSPMFGGEDIDFEGDSGLESLDGEKQRYITLETTFSFELTQEINQ